MRLSVLAGIVNKREGRTKSDIYSQGRSVLPPKDSINPFAPGDFAEKRVLKLVEWFSGHCRAIKS